MASYLQRHAKDLNSSKSYSDGCGKLMYDSWGGKAGLKWSNGKLNELGLSAIETLKKPCWAGYEQIGTKTLKGKEVPNCVPIKRK